MGDSAYTRALCSYFTASSRDSHIHRSNWPLSAADHSFLSCATRVIEKFHFAPALLYSTHRTHHHPQLIPNPLSLFSWDPSTSSDSWILLFTGSTSKKDPLKQRRPVEWALKPFFLSSRLHDAWWSKSNGRKEKKVIWDTHTVLFPACKRCDLPGYDEETSSLFPPILVQNVSLFSHPVISWGSEMIERNFSIGKKRRESELRDRSMYWLLFTHSYL